jgi:hypothetical protein
VIDDTAAEAALAAAEGLVPRYGPRLTADVGARIYADGGPAGQTVPDQYVDPIALGAVIVAIAQSGYQVYTDRKKNGQQPAREEIAQAIRSRGHLRAGD